MTEPTPTPDAGLLPVIQADRDAAMALSGRNYSVVDRKAILTGELDHLRVVQAFARHRLAAEQSASPSGLVAETTDRIRSLIEWLSEDADNLYLLPPTLVRRARDAFALAAPAPADADPLQSYDKFDGVGDHAETVETRARIGERYLEVYESVLADPRLAGYGPADCPSELLLDLLNGNRISPADAPEREVERLREALREIADLRIAGDFGFMGGPTVADFARAALNPTTEQEKSA